MLKLTTKDFWETRWGKNEIARTVKKNIFHPLFEKYLAKTATYIEIGCAPDGKMAYFNKYWGYDVSGIDYASSEITHKTLKQLGVENYKLFELDFTKELPENQYDVVASFGFIEHFEEIDDIFRRHIELLKKKSTLIISIPHFKNIQYFLRLIYDKKVLQVHNLKIMDPMLLKAMAYKYGARKVHYCNYYRTFGFWVDNENINSMIRKAIGKSNFLIQKVLQRFKVDNIPNRFCSPYIILIVEF